MRLNLIQESGLPASEVHLLVTKKGFDIDSKEYIAGWGPSVKCKSNRREIRGYSKPANKPLVLQL